MPVSYTHLDVYKRQPIHSAEVDGQALLNQVNTLAPESPVSAEDLKAGGWKEFFSYREYGVNGAAETEHLKLALERIRQETPIPGDWDLVRARTDQFRSIPAEHERIKILLKKETQQRLDWDKEHGY